MKTLKEKVRDTIVGRNTIEKMGKSMHYKNPYGQKYLNKMSVDLMRLAKKRNPLLPYYLVTRKI